MEVSTETWRVKHHKNWLIRKNDQGDENDTKEDELRMKKDATLCFWVKKSKCRSKNPSVQSLVTSLNDNCCLCIGALARYIKEVFGCVFCLACCRIPSMAFEQLLCEWLEATGDACRDLVYFVRKILQVCVGIK